MTTPQSIVARWALVAVLPFWSVYFAHVMLGANRPTGFIILDCAYYCANGREIFERGNGLAYCNPYDPDPAAPVIYWHWLPWLLGAGTRILGLDTGFTLCLLGAIGGLACAWLTFRLVEAVLPTSRFLVPCFLFTMWGGGLLVLSAVATNLALGRPPLTFLLQHDPFEGMWFLNWGRNLILPTEAVYHALAVGAWLAAVRDRPWTAVGCVAALAATHPFSGIQQLLVVGAWFAWRALTRLRLEWPAVAHLAVFLAFCSYYFGYLPRFPQHQDIHGRWSLEWNLGLVSLLAAGVPVFALAAARCWRDRHHWRPEMTFFLIAAAVSLTLAKHELFVPARQPLHFTRGYTWLPLCLLGLPLVQQGLGLVRAPPRGPHSAHRGRGGIRRARQRDLPRRHVESARRSASRLPHVTGARRCLRVSGKRQHDGHPARDQPGRRFMGGLQLSLRHLHGDDATARPSLPHTELRCAHRRSPRVVSTWCYVSRA